MNKVYIVYSGTGEYEDREEKMLGIYSTKKSANIYLKALRDKAERLGIHRDGDNRNASVDICGQGHKYMGSDYTGIWFYITGPHDVLP